MMMFIKQLHCSDEQNVVIVPIQIPTYQVTYLKSGTYNMKCKIIDSDDLSDTDSLVVTVNQGIVIYLTKFT